MTADDFDPFGGEDSAPAAEHAPAQDEEAVTTHYGSADEFVRKQLISTYRRRVIAYGSGVGMRWKAAWWESKEAVQRIEALWRAWEAARQDEKDGPSTWWVNHCDPHMNVLLSMDGPFADSRDENDVGDPLPYTPPPVGMFEDDNQPPLYTEQISARNEGLRSMGTSD